MNVGPPYPRITKTNGQIDSTAAIGIQFGNYPGSLKKIVYAEATRSVYEFVLSSPAEPGVVTAELRVQKDLSRPTSSIARFAMVLYAMLCYGMVRYGMVWHGMVRYGTVR